MYLITEGPRLAGVQQRKVLRRGDSGSGCVAADASLAAGPAPRRPTDRRAVVVGTTCQMLRGIMEEHLLQMEICSSCQTCVDHHNNVTPKSSSVSGAALRTTIFSWHLQAPMS